VLGVVVLGEHLAVGGPAALALAIAVAAMVAATVALGRSQAIGNGDGPTEQPGTRSGLDEATLAAVGASGGPAGRRDHLD
jgi:hypothetical protein